MWHVTHKNSFDCIWFSKLDLKQSSTNTLIRETIVILVSDTCFCILKSSFLRKVHTWSNIWYIKSTFSIFFIFTHFCILCQDYIWCMCYSAVNWQLIWHCPLITLTLVELNMLYVNKKNNNNKTNKKKTKKNLLIFCLFTFLFSDMQGMMITGHQKSLWNSCKLNKRCVFCTENRPSVGSGFWR